MNKFMFYLKYKAPPPENRLNNSQGPLKKRRHFTSYVGFGFVVDLQSFIHSEGD